MSQQLGFATAMTNDIGNENIIHVSSVKSKRLTRSMLVAEHFATVLAYDVANITRATFNEFFDRDMQLIFYKDSLLLFDSIVETNSTTEKQLFIGLFMLRESYGKRELTRVVWIPSSQNLADALTKGKCSEALQILMKTNKVSFDAKV